MTGSPRSYAVVERHAGLDQWRAVCRSLDCVRIHPGGDAHAVFWHMEWTDRERADADAADHNDAAHRAGAAS